MNNLFKYIVAAFVLIIMGAIIVVQFLPKPKLSFTERQNINLAIQKLNSELPQEIGTIGQFEKASFRNDTLAYYYVVYGGKETDEFYEENFNEVRELMKYLVICMNGNRNTGTKMAQWINSVNIPIQVNISTLGTKTFKWTYEGRELLDFIHKVRISPTEALHTVIEVWIKLANLSLPLFADDINVQSISNNTIAKSMSPNERLIRILQKNDNIIFVSEIKEKDFSFDEVRANASNSIFVNAFTKEISKDADVREFLDLIATSHSNLIYRWCNVSYTDSADVVIPYMVLKQYSNNRFN